MLRFIYSGAEQNYAECRYAELHYAECHYTECRGAVTGTSNIKLKQR